MEAKILRALWQSAAILNDYRYSPNHWRRDSLGRMIYWFACGDKKHPNGWDVGYIVAKADGGCEEISNMQVEHYETTAEKENVRRWFKNWRTYNPDLSVYGTGQRISPFIGNF